MDVWIFLALRVFHILTAALWLGGAVLLSTFLVPVVEQVGPAGGQVMAGLTRRGVHTFLATLAGITLVSGLWLYWRFTGGLDPAISGSGGGLSFGVGGVIGVLAAIVGGAVVGRSAKGAVALAARAASLPDGEERASLLRTVEGLRRRLAMGSRVAIVLLVITTVLMAIGHYV
jgi:uncharacterized membrane protein